MQFWVNSNLLSSPLSQSKLSYKNLILLSFLFFSLYLFLFLSWIWYAFILASHDIIRFITRYYVWLKTLQGTRTCTCKCNTSLFSKKERKCNTSLLTLITYERVYLRSLFIIRWILGEQHFFRHILYIIKHNFNDREREGT